MSLHRTQQPSAQVESKEQGSLAPGSVVQQRYQILELVGSGGFAFVYKARDLRFEKASRICAVKEMYNTITDPSLRKLAARDFDREANVLASLNHDAVPSIFDYFTESDRIYLIMEFIDGQDLERLIDSSPEPVAQNKVVDWAIQICDVLSYLHSHKPEPYVFRDLKPSNIMLSQRSKIMLVDYGIAKVFQRNQRGTMIGTEGYSPPEQYRGAGEPRGDLYSLGATMHHMLTKRDPRLEPPFSFHERPIRDINPDVPEILTSIIDKLLEYDVERRFGSAAELKQALLTLTTPAALPAPTTLPAGPTVPIPLTSAVSYGQTGNVVPIWEFSCEDEIGSSPVVSDGVLYVGSFDHNLYALDAKTGEFIWKYPTDDSISSSPCVWEDLVLVGSEDHMMYAIQKGSGGIAWSAPTKDRIRASPRCHPLGHVFFGSDDHCFYNLSVRNGRQVWAYSETEGPIRSSAALSDDLAYFGSDDTNVYAVSIQTGKRKWRFSTSRPVISSPLFYEGLLFFGSLDSSFYAVDAVSGWAVWSRRTQSWIVSNPAVHESLGFIYIGSGDRTVYAFEYSRGRQVWKFETEGPIGSSPAVSEEAVYIGSSDGYLYSLDARTGELRWKFHAGSRINCTPMISNDMVFVASMNNHKVFGLLL